MIASSRIGMPGSMLAVGVNPSSPEKWPSWKIRTTVPYIADSDRTFMTIALTGSSTEPKARRPWPRKGLSVGPRAGTSGSPGQQSQFRDRAGRLDTFICQRLREDGRAARVALIVCRHAEPVARCGLWPEVSALPPPLALRSPPTC